MGGFRRLPRLVGSYNSHVLARIKYILYSLSQTPSLLHAYFIIIIINIIIIIIII